MKIVIYTLPDCPFSKAEKDYLTAKNMPFEEKSVDKDRTILDEMVSVSEGFAGVPFTIITKDDGKEVKVKGFTKEDFEKELTSQQTTSAIPPPATVGAPSENLSNVMDTLSSMSSSQPTPLRPGSAGQASQQTTPLTSADSGMSIPPLTQQTTTNPPSFDSAQDKPPTPSPAIADSTLPSDASISPTMPSEPITPSAPVTPPPAMPTNTSMPPTPTDPATPPAAPATPQMPDFTS